MRRTLRFELAKIVNPVTLIYWGIFLILFTIASIHEPKFLRAVYFGLNGFRYDEEIILNTIRNTSFYKYVIVVFFMFITSREFGNNTIIRSIYEGFSRNSLFLGKISILTLLIFSVFLLTRIILAMVFAFKGLNHNAILFMLFDYHFVIVELFSCFFLGMLGLMLSAVTKNPYWSIGLFATLVYAESKMFVVIMMTQFQDLSKYFIINRMINFQEFLRFGDMRFFDLFYFYFLQFLFMAIVYLQYQKITWLKKQ